MNEAADRDIPDDRSIRWVDLRSASALTGVSRERIAWAMAEGDVRFRRHVSGHHHVPLLALDDVAALAGQRIELAPGG